ncbi:MAG: methylated-DNA--[protein]-cysteine S-methyltransferase [Bacteroidales bacterium]|nr:methylated-DNA--[protein]-cysteine S-methyltransferase [Bacteroidales bacterium]
MYEQNKYIYQYNSPLGNITMGADGENLVGLWFDNQQYFASTMASNTQKKDLPVFQMACMWLDMYFSGQAPDFVPPVKITASPFRHLVWNILQSISFGTVLTYKDIAEKIARQTGRQHMSAQAVGGSIAHNPVSIIIPCHRVIGSNGNLIGYAGGLYRKQKLLALEGIVLGMPNIK